LALLVTAEPIAYASVVTYAYDDAGRLVVVEGVLLPLRKAAEEKKLCKAASVVLCLIRAMSGVFRKRG